VELVFVAETARDLSKVTWLTHDCFFDLDQMSGMRREVVSSCRSVAGPSGVGSSE